VTRLTDVTSSGGPNLYTGSDRLFFNATGPFGDELFSTDGFSVTAYDVNPDGDARPREFIEFQGDVYFAATNSVARQWYRWHEGQVEVVTPANFDVLQAADPMWAFLYDERLFFTGFGHEGRELYWFDGTTMGQVADLNPGPSSAFSGTLAYFLELNDRVLFKAFAGPNSLPLLALDGGQLRTLRQGVFPNTFAFARSDALAGEWYYFEDAGKILRTDGLQVEDVADIEFGVLWSPSKFTGVGDTVFFRASGPNGVELFSTDGQEITEYDLRPDGNSSPRNLKPIGDTLFFEASLSFERNGSELMVFRDGQAEVVELRPDDPVRPGEFIEHDGWLYFSSYRRHEDGQKHFLFRTDGTHFVEIPGGDIRGQTNSFATASASMADGLFFTNTGPGGLFWTDGQTVQQIELLNDTPHYQRLVSYRGALYYFASGSPEQGGGLYKVVGSDSVARVDYNGNGELDVQDIDHFSAQLRLPSPGPVFDLNEDGQFDLSDRRFLIREIAKTYFGDADLDGQFTATDLVSVFQAGEYEDAFEGNSTWATGDWDGDGQFTSTDFVLAFVDGGYEQGTRTDAAAVPEPTSVLLLVTNLIAVAVCRRRLQP
jgi:ELWxxDGT repeat protein